MRYRSTRGGSPAVSFEGAILNGLAPDGGLYVPESWPHISEDQIRSFREKPYEEIVFEIVREFIGDEIPAAELQKLVADAYSHFASEDPAPLTPLGENRWLLDLYYGPTFAFKDYALQLLARLQNYFLNRSGKRITILTATSGDTGAAAIEACRGLDTVEIFVLHPHNGISPLHRRLMTTVAEHNVHNIAIDGTFDDCQALVKCAFSDEAFRRECELSTLNSINWGRVVGQIAYYFSSAAKLGAPDIAPIYSVPTGNFGDVYSGYAALKMGLPIERLVVATNENDILHRFFEEGGVYSRREVFKTRTTPCMDIQAPSNFERALFDLYFGDSALVRQNMKDFANPELGKFIMDDGAFGRAKDVFSSECATQENTLETIRSVYKTYGRVVDPHTAVGIWAAEQCKCIQGATPVVYLATSHPAKSQDIVKEALGDVAYDIPAPLKEVMRDGPEHFEELPADIDMLKELMRRSFNVGGRSSIAAE